MKPEDRITVDRDFIKRAILMDSPVSRAELIKILSRIKALETRVTKLEKRQDELEIRMTAIENRSREKRLPPMKNSLTGGRN